MLSMENIFGIIFAIVIILFLISFNPLYAEKKKSFRWIIEVAVLSVVSSMATYAIKKSGDESPTVELTLILFVTFGAIYLVMRGAAKTFRRPPCEICKKTKMSGSYHKGNNGYICDACFNTTLKAEGMNLFEYSDGYADRVDSLKGKSETFNATITVGKLFTADEHNKLFKIGKHIEYFPFSSLINFELNEDGDAIITGGLGRAVVGGALFGGVGAIVGGVTGKRKSKATVDSMYIRISLNDKWVKHTQIDLINSAIPKNSYAYKELRKQADKIISALEFIINQQQVNTQPPIEQLSAADEIMKYKRLLDCGAITEIEYQSKKDKLLE